MGSTQGNNCIGNSFQSRHVTIFRGAAAAQKIGLQGNEGAIRLLTMKLSLEHCMCIQMLITLLSTSITVADQFAAAA